jgi:hypothetical protein
MCEPATRKATVGTAPTVRKGQCEKCPFGTNLNLFEMFQAHALKQRLAEEPGTLWACHETAGKDNRTVSRKALLCAGFAEWRKQTETSVND